MSWETLIYFSQDTLINIIAARPHFPQGNLIHLSIQLGETRSE